MCVKILRFYVEGEINLVITPLMTPIKSRYSVCMFVVIYTYEGLHKLGGPTEGLVISI